MSKKQLYSVNERFITLHCSDGNSAFRPSRREQQRVVMPDRTVDYMRECTGNDNTLRLWKTKIGQFLARYVLERPDVNYREYSLFELPKGYSLWMHYKGDKADPRQDAYLYGSNTVHNFRSPAEFFFHAKWLLLGCPTPESVPDNEKFDEELWGTPMPEDYSDRCMCTYCGKTSQDYISQNFSNYHPRKRR